MSARLATYAELEETEKNFTEASEDAKNGQDKTGIA